VTSITRRDCRELVQGIADRGAPIVANRTAALLSRLFRFAADEEIIEANPAAHLSKPGVEAGSRPDGERQPKPYDADEVRAIWQATETMSAPLKALNRLGLLTGQRPTEIRDLEWQEIDQSWWSIPSRRTKNGHEHRVYLTPLALDLLKAVPRIADEPYVFAGWRGKRQLADVNRQVFVGVRRRDRRVTPCEIRLRPVWRLPVWRSKISPACSTTRTVRASQPPITRTATTRRSD
jgi:integrase